MWNNMLTSMRVRTVCGRTPSLLIAALLVVAGVYAQPATIVFTARADGRLENCRCPADPNGALEKRLPEINRLRELGPVLLLDAGNFFPETIDTLGARAMLNAYALHGYDAVTVGVQELMHGAPWVREIERALPVVSANVRYRDGSPAGKAVRVIERGGTAFAVTGVTSRAAVRRLGPSFYEQFSLRPLDGALAEAFAGVPADAKRIVLAQMPLDSIRARAGLWEAVDLVAGGHNSDVVAGSERAGDAVLLEVGAKSRRIGLVQFRGRRVKADLQAIHPSLPDDPRIVEIVIELKRARRQQETATDTRR